MYISLDKNGRYSGREGHCSHAVARWMPERFRVRRERVYEIYFERGCFSTLALCPENGTSEMEQKIRKQKLLRAADKFLGKHEGHEVAASSSESHYFNLWCDTCEEINRVRVRQGSSRDRSFKAKCGGRFL